MSEQTPSTPSILDDDQLNEHERQFIEIFEQRRQSATSQDDGTLTSAEDDELKAPATSSSDAAPGATSLEGAEGAPAIDPNAQPPGAEVQPTSGEAPPATSEEAEPPPAQGASAFTLAGVDYTPEQLTKALQAQNWLTQLSPDQVRSIDALLSGQYRLVAANEAAPTETTPPVAPAPHQPPVTPPVTPATPAPEEAGDWLDPRAQAEINRLRAEMAQRDAQFAQLQQTIQQSLPPLVQTQQQAEFNAHIAKIDAASEKFRSQYNLTPEQLQAAQQAVADAQVLPSLIQRHGDTEQGMIAALDMMFWTNPSLRDPYLQAKSAAEQADLAQQQQQSTRKQQQLTALSASGGSVPRRDPVPTDRESRHQAMVEAIASAQNGQ